MRPDYDLLAFPGASKAVVDNPTVTDAIKLLHGMHSFETIHILDHVHCGAFGEVADEREAHSKMLQDAEKVLLHALPGVEVVSHLLGVKSEIAL